MKKYRCTLISWYTAKIEEVEVERETDHSVWINGSRYGKKTSYDNYFDTWDEAKAELLKLAENEVRGKMVALDRAKGYLGSVKGVKKIMDFAHLLER